MTPFLAKRGNAMSARLGKLACGALAAVLAFPPQPNAQGGDAGKGREIAGKSCASCHEMSGAGRTYQGRYVPSFQEIAATPHYSTVRLRRIIAVPPHREMPGLSLRLEETSDLAAFIRSLRAPGR